MKYERRRSGQIVKYYQRTKIGELLNVNKKERKQVSYQRFKTIESSNKRRKKIDRLLKKTGKFLNRIGKKKR